MALACQPQQKAGHDPKADRHMFSLSDDSALMKQILGTHSPDGRDVDVKPLLNIVEDVLNRATPSILLPAIACKCMGGEEAHATTVAVFNTLSSYRWEAKAVMAVAAFALTYGQFWLTSKLHSTGNPLAKSVATLKAQLPETMMDNSDQSTLKARLDALDALTKAMLDVTKCIVAFRDLPAAYIAPHTDQAMTTHVATAVYWTIRCVVACSASQMTSLTANVGHRHHEYVRPGAIFFQSAGRP